MWVARDKDGILTLFKRKPIRDSINGEFSFWSEVNDGYNGTKPHWPKDYFEIDPSLFQDLKWEDEPIEVELNIVNKKL